MQRVVCVYEATMGKIEETGRRTEAAWDLGGLLQLRTMQVQTLTVSRSPQVRPECVECRCGSICE